MRGEQRKKSGSCNGAEETYVGSPVVFGTRRLLDARGKRARLKESAKAMKQLTRYEEAPTTMVR